MRSSAALLPQRDPRLTRNPRISLRRRLRAIGRALLHLGREIIWTSGYRSGREDFLQMAAREARERSEAIDASVGAMSAADIRRIKPPEPSGRDRRDQ